MDLFRKLRIIKDNKLKNGRPVINNNFNNINNDFLPIRSRTIF